MVCAPALPAAAVVAALLLVAAQPGCGEVVHVSPRVKHAAGNGSASSPFTLTGAVRALRGRAAGVTVLLDKGDYFLSEPLVLTVADGGSRGHPVTYRSSSLLREERARLIGGVEVPLEAFRPVLSTATPGLLVAELAPLGIRNASMLGGGGGDGLKAELFLERDGAFAPEQLSMDPNPRPDGKWRWVGLDEVVGGSGAWFLLNDTDRARASRWQAAATTAGSGFDLFGHWGDEGGVSDARVQSIVPVGGTSAANITMSSSPCSSRCAAGFRVTAAMRFVAVGSLQFVDAPGEYWIDRETLRLYYIRRPSCTARLFLSVVPSLASPQASYKHPQALVQLQGTSFLSWIGITTALSTQSLFSASSSEGILLQDSLFQASGASGVSVDGNFSTVSGCIVSHCGATALSISGGNWNKRNPTLFVPAEIEVRNSTFSNWARWQRTPNSAGLSWTGVGHLVSGNVFRDAPEPAVLGNGNVDCVFEHNLITNVNYEQSDMGAFYHGSASGGYNFGWTQPGNVIRSNHWQNIRFQEQGSSVGEKFTTQVRLRS